MAKIDLISLEWCELIFKDKIKLTVRIKCAVILVDVSWLLSLL